MTTKVDGWQIKENHDDQIVITPPSGWQPGAFVPGEVAMALARLTCVSNGSTVFWNYEEEF